jgi:hypothetical protein
MDSFSLIEIINMYFRRFLLKMSAKILFFEI